MFRMIGHDRILKKLSCHQALSASGGSQVQFARSAPRVARALQIVRNSVPHRPGSNSHSETGPGSCRWLCRAAPRIIPMSGLKAYCTDLRDRSPMRTVRSPIRCSSSLMISGRGVKASTVIVSLAAFGRFSNIVTKMPLYAFLGRSSCPLNTSSFPCTLAFERTVYAAVLASSQSRMFRCLDQPESCRLPTEFIETGQY